MKPTPSDAPAPCRPAVLTLSSDGGRGQTHWAIVTTPDTVWAQGTVGGAAGAEETAEVCVPEGCHEVVVWDEGADGLCCEVGEGGYRLTDGMSGELVVSGARFHGVDSRVWCWDGPSSSGFSCLTPGGEGALCGGRADDPAGALAPTAASGVPWRGGAIVAIVALAVWWWHRDRGRRGPVRWAHLAAIAVVAVGVGWLAWRDVARLGPLIAHDAARDLLWALDLSEGGPGPRTGPRIGMTEGSLGRWWYGLLAVPMGLGGLDGVAAALVGVRALTAAALFHLTWRVFGALAAWWVLPWWLLHEVVLDHERWLTHANLAPLAMLLAALAAVRAYGEGRGAHAVPMLFWLAFAMQMHLTAIGLVVALLWVAWRRGEDVPWPDTFAALFAASVPFWGGIVPLLDDIRWEGLGASLARQTALVPAIGAGLVLCRPRWVRTRGGRGLGIALGLAVLAGWWAQAPSLRLLDWALGAGAGPPAEGMGASWREVARAMLSLRALAAWDAAVVLGVAVWGVVRLARAPSPRGVAVVKAWAVAQGAVTGAVWVVAGPELRYAWLLMPVGAMVLALGASTVWTAAYDRAWRIGWPAKLGLTGGAAAIALWTTPLSAPSAMALAGAGWAVWAPRAVAGWLAVSWLAFPVAVFKQVDTRVPPVVGCLATDRGVWDALASLPGMGQDKVPVCVHWQVPDRSARPDSWRVWAALASDEDARPRCDTRWIVTRDASDEGAWPDDPLAAVGLHVERARAGWVPGTLRVETGFDEWRSPVWVSTVYDWLPIHALGSAGVPPRGIGIGDVPWTLQAPPGQPVATVTGSVAPGGAPLTSLVVRAVPAGPSPCEVRAEGPDGPLSEDSEVAGSLKVLWRFGLSSDRAAVPVTVTVRGCALGELDVFPRSEGSGPSGLER